MAGSNGDILTSQEIDLLQEIMNIGFGQAAADLAEVIDIFVSINSPQLNIIKATDIHGRIQEEIPDFAGCSIVEQGYMGATQGLALMVFPQHAEKQLLSLFPGLDSSSVETDIGELEKEVLLEVGNILIGACVGKMLELLKTDVTYLPPRTLVGEDLQSVFSQDSPKQDSYAMFLRTDFGFEDRSVSGYLFLVFDEDSIDPLKAALESFAAQYE